MAIKTNDVKAKEKEPVVFNVLEECGTIATRSKRKGDEIIRLDYGQWGDNSPKYEIRIWTERENGEYAPGKGIGLTGEELIALGDIIQKLQEED